MDTAIYHELVVETRALLEGDVLGRGGSAYRKVVRVVSAKKDVVSDDDVNGLRAGYVRLWTSNTAGEPSVQDVPSWVPQSIFRLGPHTGLTW